MVVSVVPGGRGAAAPGWAGTGTGAGVGATAPGIAPGVTALRRPVVKSWFKIDERSAASANRIGMIASSSSATWTSTSRTMSSRRAMFAAVSVIKRMFVSRCAMSAPRVEMSGRIRFETSAAELYRSAMICVMTSSVVRDGSGWVPTIVGTARSRAPSMRTIL